MESQGRYKHLFRPENEHIIKEIQEEIDKNCWLNVEKNKFSIDE